MRIEFVAAVATSTVTHAALHHGAVAIGATTGSTSSAGDVFAQLLAALGQPSADTNTAALPEVVEPKNADALPSKPADHPANDPPGQTLRNLLAELHAADSKPDNQGEIVSDAAKLLTKTSSDAGTPADGAPPPDPDKQVPANDPKPVDDANAQLAQLLAAMQPPPAASGPVQVSPANVKPSDTNLPISTPNNILPAATQDAIASGIGQNATQTKPARDAKREEIPGKAVSEKSQSPAFGANALAALSTAADHSFSNSPPEALSIYTNAGGTNPNGNDPDRQPNNPHPHSSASVNAAPQASLASGPAPSSPSAPPSPAGDSNTLAVANGSVQNPQPPSIPATQFHTNLQVGPAPTHAVPDIGALAVTIAAKSQDGIKHFDIRLDPPELGRVDVRLTVDDSGKAQASLAVEKPQTLELLQKDSSTLERALKDAGLDLSQNGLNFSLKGQQQHQAGGENSPAPRGRALHVRAVAVIDQPAPINSSNGVGQPRLDIRV